ncbi:uncharacterized protein LOC102201880 [Pundamilia nyererei]|uniref:Uncharacterized protein LOC102201880 n=1 Tax=Pundamilia nyererei TaxID=303518 RepID=A0A9Y3VVV6_9CICH|nr:PREDICTED: uncharacterized protein LOC102201880 [Pundamilia nyererei]
MAANICCCLFAFLLSCKVTAGLMHEVAEEERSVVLRCPLSEERRVTWSRERNDSREEILTADGGRLIRHDDITKQYTAYDDLSLYIYRAAVSHSGTYFCDDKAAVALTVIPSGTMRLAVVGGRNVTLRCPHAGRRSGSPSWSRSFAGKQQIVCPHASTVGQMLIIPDVQLADSGLYHCNGKPAAYLKVIKEEKSDSDRKTTRTTPPKTTTTSLTTRTAATAAAAPEEILVADYLWHMTVRTLIGLLYLIIMISITAVTWRKARQIQKRDRSRF